MASWPHPKHSVQMAAESLRAAVADSPQHFQLWPRLIGFHFRPFKPSPTARMMSATSRGGRFIS